MLNLVRRISFNHATFGPDVSFAAAIEAVARSGVGGFGVWAERLDGMSYKSAGSAIRDLGLEVSGVNRGGFFTAVEAHERRESIEHTKRQIESTRELGADTLVVVPGGLSKDFRQIDSARAYVKDGLSQVEEFAREYGVKLAVEPFHPALSATRGVINTLDSALDLCEGFGAHVGVVTDIFHVWWDPKIYMAIERAGARIFGHHLCDWKLDTVDPFADRGVMGEGVADVEGITAAVMRTGYQGWMEVEIFSRNDLWTMEPGPIAALCLQRALACLQNAERLSRD